MESLLVIGFFSIITFVTLALGVRTVPQGSRHIVQRLGKFHKILEPGINIILPYIDNVAYRVSTKDLIVDVPPQDIITKDNVTVSANAIGFVKITDPRKAVYGVSDYLQATVNLIQTSLRALIGEIDLDEALSHREQIKAKIRDAISPELANWGLTLVGVEVQDLHPTPSVIKSMEEQMAAERDRRAMISRAEGYKEAAIREAQGKYEAAKLEAEAVKVKAAASQDAIKMIISAAGEGTSEAAIGYLLGERYIQAIQVAASSESSKTILLPGDLQAAIRGVFAGTAVGAAGK